MASAAPRGLRNPNHYCYHNATLQCLSSLWHVPGFRAAVDQLQDPRRAQRPVVREFADMLRLLAEPNLRVVAGWSEAFVWRLVNDPVMNPPGPNHFEFADDGWLRTDDAADLLRRYIHRVFEANPGNPFELRLRRQTFRCGRGGGGGDAGSDGGSGSDDSSVDGSSDDEVTTEPPIVERVPVLHVSLDAGANCSLPATLKRQIFHQTVRRDLLQSRSIVPHPTRGFAPCLAVTNGEDKDTGDSLALDFDLADMLVDGPLRYDCVAVCSFVAPRHYVAYVRRLHPRTGARVWYCCDDSAVHGPWGGMRRCSQLLQRRGGAVRFALFERSAPPPDHSPPGGSDQADAESDEDSGAGGGGGGSGGGGGASLPWWQRLVGLGKKDQREEADAAMARALQDELNRELNREAEDAALARRLQAGAGDGGTEQAQARLLASMANTNRAEQRAWLAPAASDDDGSDDNNDDRHGRRRGSSSLSSDEEGQQQQEEENDDDDEEEEERSGVRDHQPRRRQHYHHLNQQGHRSGPAAKFHSGRRGRQPRRGTGHGGSRRRCNSSDDAEEAERGRKRRAAAARAAARMREFGERQHAAEQRERQAATAAARARAARVRRQIGGGGGGGGTENDNDDEYDSEGRRGGGGDGSGGGQRRRGSAAASPAMAGEGRTRRGDGRSRRVSRASSPFDGLGKRAGQFIPYAVFLAWAAALAMIVLSILLRML